ncbi:MAG: hypothetical protein AAFO74_16960 [Pseudomonadota bacterium]
MADIFEEVEEGLRQERMTGLWKRYGIFAYIGAALLIGGVALNEYMQIQAKQTTSENAGRLEAALEDVEARNYEAAATQLDSIIADGITPANISAHYLAGVRLDGNGDAAAAAAVLKSAVGEAVDPTEKLALIKAAYLQADDLSRAELEALVAPLAASEGPFAALAKELIAAKALQDGDVAFARREFNFLRLAQNVPPGVLTRAEQALAALPPMSAEVETPEVDSPETPAEATVETAEETESSAAEVSGETTEEMPE